MDEHRWKYRPSRHSEGIAQDFEQQLKATTETPAPSICVLRDGVWCHVAGPWVAEEILRLSKLVPESAVEGEQHHWKFKVGSGAYDQYRAVCGQGHDYARVEVLSDGAWDIFVGQPVAEEMLRLATENEELRRCLDFHMLDAARQKATMQALRGDLLKLAETRVRELELEVAAKEALIHMAVARLGGEIEGAPTHRINFLQRIDELRRIEGQRDDLIEANRELHEQLEDLEARCAQSIEEWQAID